MATLDEAKEEKIKAMMTLNDEILEGLIVEFQDYIDAVKKELERRKKEKK